MTIVNNVEEVRILLPCTYMHTITMPYLPATVCTCVYMYMYMHTITIPYLPATILVCTCTCISMQELAMKLDVVVEPSFISLGPFHMAVGINDRSWIYEIRDHGIYDMCI